MYKRILHREIPVKAGIGGAQREQGIIQAKPGLRCRFQTMIHAGYNGRDTTWVTGDLQ
jgi:hypothetical protein